jgi:hypothetical protein
VTSIRKRASPLAAGSSPPPQESARLPRDEHPPAPKNTLFSDDYTMPEGDGYIIREA